jgi:hypothetical protein
MSLTKAIEHGKEHRKPYRGSKAYCKAERNHGAWVEDTIAPRYKARKARMKGVDPRVRIT